MVLFNAGEVVIQHRREVSFAMVISPSLTSCSSHIETLVQEALHRDLMLQLYSLKIRNNFDFEYCFVNEAHGMLKNVM